MRTGDGTGRGLDGPSARERGFFYLTTALFTMVAAVLLVVWLPLAG
jgi:hypothetical protein